MNFNRQDLMVMDPEELKNRILALASAYRNERKRNEKLEETLKKSQKDIAGMANLQSSLKKLVDDSRGMDEKAGMMDREFSRVGQYKQTISK